MSLMPIVTRQTSYRVFICQYGWRVISTSPGCLGSGGGSRVPGPVALDEGCRPLDVLVIEEGDFGVAQSEVVVQVEEVGCFWTGDGVFGHRAGEAQLVEDLIRKKKKKENINNNY